VYADEMTGIAWFVVYWMLLNLQGKTKSLYMLISHLRAPHI